MLSCHISILFLNLTVFLDVDLLAEKDFCMQKVCFKRNSKDSTHKKS